MTSHMSHHHIYYIYEAQQKVIVVGKLINTGVTLKYLR